MINQSINNTNQSINNSNQPINNNNDAPNASDEKSPHYFDKPVFLTVSGQLHLEAVCNGIHKVILLNLWIMERKRISRFRRFSQ